MAAYVLANDSEDFFDPAVGAGALFRAAKRITAQSGKLVTLCGTEVDADALTQARESGLSDADLVGVEMRDFATNPPPRCFRAIAANPPYIRRHRLPGDARAVMRQFGADLISKPLDGRAGLHIYFLLRALSLLETGGRLAFIMPADTCEGVFAQTLWRWIAQRFRLDAAVTFAADASPFPSIDTNAILFFIENSPPTPNLFWARVKTSDRYALTAWVASAFLNIHADSLTVCERDLNEALETGLSRRPAADLSESARLGDFARVKRGVATGANDFFFFTVEQARALGIPDDFLIPAVGRARDITGDEITNVIMSRLERAGRPTKLFAPDGRPLDEFPQTVRDYLKQGEIIGIHKRTLIATRRPWYKIESRAAPPFLFAYVGQRSKRFIRNTAGVIPLSVFLCVYPRYSNATDIEKLWRVFNHPDVIANLRLVGKSYGSGAIKVEPRALERLPIPSYVLAEAGLSKVPSHE